MAQLYVHLNGRLVPANEAHLSVFDVGFLHGASAFTTMRAHNGVVFRLDRHLGRLMDAVQALRLRCGATVEALAAGVRELLAASALADGQLRITLSPGSAHGEGEPTTLITAGPLAEYPAWWYEKGVMATVSPFKQSPTDPTVGLKTGCYLPRVLARRLAAEQGGEEALWFTDDNRLAEACFSNVFLVLGGEVRTPPLSTPVLAGIVREAVLELCPSLDIPCRDDAGLTVRDMLDAGEVFVTNSLTGIRPVVRIERHAVGDQAPGMLTRRLMDGYRELLDRECAK